MIESIRLNKWYGDVHALNNLSFSLGTGEVLGFLGPNGAGKSTTMKILTCFFKADSGKAVVDGLDVNKNPLEVRQRIGYLHENAPYYPDMRVDDFIRFMARMRGMSEYKKQMDYVLELFKLNAVKNKRMSSLSKGYRQRVSFAQALIHDPKILILDEPTNGLDPNQIFELRQVIKELAHKKTIIMCSHILAEVSIVCSRILIMIDGKQVAFGTQREISSNLLGGEEISLSVTGKGDIRDSLQKLPEIISIEKKPPGEYVKNIKSYKLAYSGKNPGTKIFDLAVEGGFKIHEIKHIPLDLEAVFRKFTLSLKET